MPRRLASWAAALSLLAIAGCAAPLQVNPAASGGPRPDNYQAIADSWLNETLTDPRGRRVTFNGEPQQYQWTFADAQMVWLVCGTFDSRDGHGEWTGARPFYVMIQNGAAVDGDVLRPGQRQNLPRPCERS